MVVVVSVVAMFDVVVVLDVVVGDGEIVVPKNQRVILVAVKGYKSIRPTGVIKHLARNKFDP